MPAGSIEAMTTHPENTPSSRRGGTGFVLAEMISADTIPLLTTIALPVAVTAMRRQTELTTWEPCGQPSTATHAGMPECWLDWGANCWASEGLFKCIPQKNRLTRLADVPQGIQISEFKGSAFNISACRKLGGVPTGCATGAAGWGRVAILTLTLLLAVHLPTWY